MSQRNPMNERYTTEKHTGNTRRSAASAKPKTKVAGTVTYGSAKKTPKDRKAELKAKRKEDAAKQRELDKKYYKPDTERYQKLRRVWWGLLGGAVVCTAASWFLRQVQPTWMAFACLILAYVLIIAAFWVDFSKIRKERRAYQTRMLALEIEQKKKEEQEAKLSAKKGGSKGGKKGKGAKANASEAKEDETTDSVKEEEAPKKRRGLFGRKSEPEVQEAQE